MAMQSDAALRAAITKAIESDEAVQAVIAKWVDDNETGLLEWADRLTDRASEYDRQIVIDGESQTSVVSLIKPSYQPEKTPVYGRSTLAITTDTATQHKFRYRALGQKHLFRLLCLLPGEEADPLTGSLFHCSFKKAPSYEALSYVWGSQSKPHAIDIVTGGSLVITDSLLTALRRLRYKDRRRILWVDALCIDQDNNQERSEQVLLMPYIYAGARHVIAWLGPDDNRSGAKALRLLQKLNSTDFTTLKSMTVSQEWMKEHGLPPEDDPVWEACVEFWLRPWFRRVWIVQEVVKAKDVWMFCGPTEVRWKMLVEGVEKMKEYALISLGLYKRADLENQLIEVRYAMESFHVILSLRLQSSMPAIITEAVRTFGTRDESALTELFHGGWSKHTDLAPFLQSIVQHVRGQPVRGPLFFDLWEEMASSMLVANKNDKGVVHPLMYLLTMLQHQQATDPRDKLFALLGISREANNSSLKPNYDEPLRSVVVRFAKAFLNTNMTFTILDFAGCAGRTSDLPSWIPDWINGLLIEKRLLLAGTGTSFGYSAASDLELHIHTHDQITDAILLGGSFLGTVSRVLEPAIGNIDGTGLESMQAWDVLDIRETFFTDLDDFMREFHGYVTGEDAVDILWCTLSGKIDARGHMASTVFRDEFMTFKTLYQSSDLDDVARLEEYMKSRREFILKFLGLNSSHALCMLDNGLVALVPRQTKLGDLIFLPSGCKAPFAMRRSMENEAEFQILAVCYTHGLMFGNEHRSKFWHFEEICVR